MSGGAVDIKELLPLIFAQSKFVLRSFPQLVLTVTYKGWFWTETLFKPLIMVNSQIQEAFASAFLH